MIALTLSLAGPLCALGPSQAAERWGACNPDVHHPPVPAIDGLAYAAARKALLAAGWRPWSGHSGLSISWADDYEEVRSCGYNDAGPCLFDFSDDRDPNLLLQVTTSPEDDSPGTVDGSELTCTGSERAPTAAEVECKRPPEPIAVPEIDELAYDEARRKLVAAGWKPRRTKHDGDDLEGNGPIFWSRGYVEVENCAGAELGRCILNFVDRAGNRLKVVTAGEEGDGPKEASHAIVVDTELDCGHRGAHQRP